jgi:ABC-type uncharacterized transport system permease subunit
LALGSNYSTHFISGNSRKHQIEQNQIDVGGAKLAYGFVAILGFTDFVAFFLKQIDKWFPKVWLILNH